MNRDFEELKALTENIFNNPELGYKEFNTNKLAKDYVKKYYTNVKFEDFARTGFSFYLGDKNKDLTLGFIAELDAVYLPNHFNANKETGAAHVCGHYTQVTIALGLFKMLLDSGDYKNLNYNIKFIFVPAEEYLDLESRKELRDKKEIYYFGGKPEAMRLGVFDDVDFGICVHAIGGYHEKRSIEINSDLDGFLYKYFTFKGKASHAGFAPWDGVNAQSMAILCQNAIAFLRQQIDESKMVRINPVFFNAPMGTNVICDEIKIGTDLRSNDNDYMVSFGEKLNNAAYGSALSLGGEVIVETEMGYLPFIQDRYLSSMCKDYYLKEYSHLHLFENRAIAAAGDIGDLSFMIPCIQIGYSGFKGTIHGVDFVHDDLEFILDEFVNFLYGFLIDMSPKILKEKLYRRTYEEYEKLINTLGGN